MTVIPDTRRRWTQLRSKVPAAWPDHHVPPGWLPVGIAVGVPTVRWIYAGEAPLSEPFFAGTVSRLRASDPPAPECETELSIFEFGTGKTPPIAPSGLIFHMTRCGSTLLTNALRTHSDTIVLSEPPPFGRLLGLTSVFAHYRAHDEAGHVVIKCGTDGLFLLPAIRAALPSVPCLVLVRSPVEVMVSIAAGTPVSLINWYESRQTHRFGVPPPEVMAGGYVEFWAWIIGRFCTDALALLGDGCRVLDYSEITPGVAKRVGEFFHLSSSKESDVCLEETFRLDAKNPARVFQMDSASKRDSASETIRASAARWAEGPYQELRSRSSGWDGVKA